MKEHHRMAPTRQKLKRLTDLYTIGTEVVLKDGIVMWLQVLNPFEQDEARTDAQAARARLVLALKSPEGSEEREIVRSWFLDDGREPAIERLIDAKLGPKLLDMVNDVRSDPDWAERMLILDREEELLARPAEDSERALVAQINNDFIAEITERSNAEHDWLERKYTGLDDDGLFEEYIDAYLERRGLDISMAEYALTELWFAARVCDPVLLEDGSYDHTPCEGHWMKAYEHKAEVRALPEDLQVELTMALQRLNMSVREAKNSARQGSSSESSPLPSVPEDSSPSTQPATSVAALGL